MTGTGTAPTDIPEPMRAYVTPEGGRIRLEKTNPCIGVISIPAWKYPACKGVLNEVLHNPPRSTRTTQQGDIHSYWLWFLITDGQNDALGKGYTQSEGREYTVMHGGFTTPIEIGEWENGTPPESFPTVTYEEVKAFLKRAGPAPTETEPEQENPSPKEEPPTVRRIEYPRCFWDPAGIGGAAAFAYADAAKRPCDFNGTKQAPAEGLLPFDQINLAKIDNEKMFLRVSVGGAINHDDGTREIIPRAAPIVILDYDHVLNPDTEDYAEGIPDELRDEIEYLKQSTYCEFSKSGDGIHAYCIDNLPAPVMKGDKPFLRIKTDSKPEIFRGDGYVMCTGWRIPDACDDICEIDISAIYARQLGKSSIGKAAARTAALPACPAIDPPQEPDIDTARKYEEVILMWEEEEAGTVRTRMTKSDIPHEASEAMMSIMTRIAGDAAVAAAYRGIPYDVLATPARIQWLWEQSETYRTEYATGVHAYNSSKIESTVTKAISAGRDKYNEMMVIHRFFARGHAKSKPIASPPKPPATTHPEGFCISPDGVPEFWCDEYPHPLRYSMAHIARYAQAAMQQPNAITAWICAVFFGTAVCARQFAAELAPFGNGDSALIFPRLYAIVSGKSGAGKDDINNGMTALVHAIAEGSANANLWGLLSQNSNWTSDAAVHAAIAERPQSVAIWDECGRKIQRAKDDVIAGSMLAKITEAFSRANGVLMAPHYANPKDQQLPKGTNIWHPAMSIIGLGTPRQMEAITEDMVENGQFARFLFYTIPLRITKPVERVKFDFKTHTAINEILATATFTPDLKMATRQQILKTLKWDPNAPRSACDVRDSVRELAIAAKSDADVAILNRVFEVAGILAISRTILGTKRGLGAEYIEYDTMMECIAEARKSMWHFHDIIVDAPIFTPRELRIADAIEEIFRNELKNPFRAYYGRDIAPRLKKQRITLGGKRDEHHHIDAILRDRGIATGKEGNTPTGRKYYYDASTPTAQAEQDDYDAQLKTAAKFPKHEAEG